MSVESLALQKQLAYLEALPYQTYQIKQQILTLKKKLGSQHHDLETLSEPEGWLE